MEERERRSERNADMFSCVIFHALPQPTECLEEAWDCHEHHFENSEEK